MNTPTFNAAGPDILQRVSTDGVSSSAILDTNGNGFYNTFLGCNAVGSNGPGIGVANNRVTYLSGTDDSPEKWTTEDQWEDAREPQYGGVIGHSGFVDRSGGWDASSGGREFNPASRGASSGERPVNYARFTGVVFPGTPGTADFNDNAEFLAATQQAAPGAVADAASGAVNDTGATVEIGDKAWFRVPVA